jgi:hypothetical protein
MQIPLTKWTEVATKQIIRELQAHLYKVAAGCPDRALVEHLWNTADVLDQYWPGGPRQMVGGGAAQGPIVGERE